MLLLPFTALGDGMVIPATAFPAEIEIPDQCALIHFAEGTERLVIETRFSGPGTNFAWVVPLPSQPEIEPASTGLFPTLEHLCRPEITHKVPHYYVGALIVIVVVWGIRQWARFETGAGALILLVLLALLLAALLLPALATARARGGITAAAEAPVTILDRRIVGVYETATVASTNPAALRHWLDENGYNLPPNADPVVADYVRQGWVFAAAKVRRDRQAPETSVPHPLSFKFKTDRPVYPMRLTGLAGRPLTVELYVFGPTRAAAAGLDADFCLTSYNDETQESWHRRNPGVLEASHPLLREWTAGSKVATRLRGTLSARAMTRDLRIEWEAFSPVRKHYYSREGARTIAINTAAILFAIGYPAILLLTLSPQRPGNRRNESLNNLMLACLLLGGTVYLALPTVDVRVVRLPDLVARNNLQTILFDIEEISTNAMTESTVRLQTAERLAQWSRIQDKNAANPFLGGMIHEEDSPGNYIIRERSGRIEFVGYDELGTAVVLRDWPASTAFP
ncbi:MAG: DUF2330 domain-containing protein [Verrucomicrobiota bacterium]